MSLPEWKRYVVTGLMMCVVMFLNGQESVADSGMVYDSILDPYLVEGELELQMGDNLDSLLNLWYVNQALESAVDTYDPEADTLVPDFSDSVYMARLALIPSVVDLTYNRIVRNVTYMYNLISISTTLPRQKYKVVW